MRKKRIFVCYSRDDRMWFDDASDHSFIPWLEEALDSEADFWYDFQLRYEADEWQARIEAEIDNADAAILLISQNFVNSEFIREVELPKIRERAERNEITVIPILVGPVIWEDVPDFITQRQVLPGDEPTALLHYTESLASFAQVKVDLLRAIRKRLRQSYKSVPGPPGGQDSVTNSDRPPVESKSDTVLKSDSWEQRVAGSRLRQAVIASLQCWWWL